MGRNHKSLLCNQGDHLGEDFVIENSPGTSLRFCQSSIACETDLEVGDVTGG